MIPKNELIELIKHAARLEEEVIPIYMKHCNVAIQFVKSDPQTIQRTQNTLTRLANDSKDHQRWFLSLLEKLKKDPRDAY